MVAYSLLHLHIGHAHYYEGRKGWPMTFIYMKERSVHPYFIPERDGFNNTLDLKCYFEERRKLLQGEVLLSAPGLIASQHENIWCYFSCCKKSYLVSSHQLRLDLYQSLFYFLAPEGWFAHGEALQMPQWSLSDQTTVSCS